MAGARWRASSTHASTVSVSDASGAASAAAGGRAAMPRWTARRRAPSLFMDSMLLETEPPGLQREDGPEEERPILDPGPLVAPDSPNLGHVEVARDEGIAAQDPALEEIAGASVEPAGERRREPALAAAEDRFGHEPPQRSFHETFPASPGHLGRGRNAGGEPHTCPIQEGKPDPEPARPAGATPIRP